MSDSASEEAATACMGRNTAAPGRSAANKKASRASPGGKSKKTRSSNGRNSPGNPVCALCMSPEGDATKKWKKHFFHAEPCWRGWAVVFVCLAGPFNNKKQV